MMFVTRRTAAASSCVIICMIRVTSALVLNSFRRKSRDIHEHTAAISDEFFPQLRLYNHVGRVKTSDQESSSFFNEIATGEYKANLLTIPLSELETLVESWKYPSYRAR